TKNRIVNWFTGGLNHQVEHHIFPKVSHVHYTKISKMVRETAQEFNLPYNEYKTTRKAIIAHFKHLKEMGRKPALSAKTKKRFQNMNVQLSDRVNQMETSATLAMAAKARELKSEGKDIISLSLGEPDFTIPNFIKEAAIKAVNDDVHAYPPVDGYVELKKAIIHKFKRDNQLTYTPEQIVVSTGAKQSLYNIASVLLNPGDEVLLPAPYWVSYSDIVKLHGGVPVEIPTA